MPPQIPDKRTVEQFAQRIALCNPVSILAPMFAAAFYASLLPLTHPYHLYEITFSKTDTLCYI